MNPCAVQALQSESLSQMDMKVADGARCQRGLRGRVGLVGPAQENAPGVITRRGWHVPDFALGRSSGDGAGFDGLFQPILAHVVRRNRSQDGVLGTSQLSGVEAHDPHLAEQVTQAVDVDQALLFVGI